jgi:ABC-2 type transport system ATP-binding protein
MEEAAALADRIRIMKNGRLMALGTLGELLAQTGTSDLEAAFVATVKEAAV